MNTEELGQWFTSLQQLAVEDPDVLLSRIIWVLGVVVIGACTIFLVVMLVGLSVEKWRESRAYRRRLAEIAAQKGPEDEENAR